MNSSLENFILDYFIRCFDAKDALYEDVEHLSAKEKRQFAAPLFENSEVMEKIYAKRVEYITNNVTLSDGLQDYPVNEVFFHERFGWTVSNGEVKAFLGKTSLSGNIRVKIGKRSYFSGPGRLIGNASLEIGNFCDIGEEIYVRVERDFHPMNWPSTANFRDNFRLIADGLNFDVDYDELDNAKAGVVIGNDVWLSRGVRIFHGITLGDGCVVGEGTLVNRDCEPYGIYVGVPARLIRFRFPDHLIDELMQIKWWNWSYDEIRHNADFLGRNLKDFRGSLFDRYPDLLAAAPK